MVFQNALGNVVVSWFRWHSQFYFTEYSVWFFSVVWFSISYTNTFEYVYRNSQPIRVLVSAYEGNHSSSNFSYFALIVLAVKEGQSSSPCLSFCVQYTQEIMWDLSCSSHFHLFKVRPIMCQLLLCCFCGFSNHKWSYHNPFYDYQTERSSIMPLRNKMSL